jgi:proline iminopeptidase
MAYPVVDPYDEGMLDVGDGQLIAWDVAGDPTGKPAIVLHGGPGSGCHPWHRTYLDPSRYRIVLFDQRGCGRSRPHASEPDVDLSTNTTSHLIADIERLREHLGVERWLVWGGSWGSVLGLAYAEAHPDRVTEMILWGVATGRRSEFDWLFRGGVGAFVPERWHRLVEALPPERRSEDVVDAYADLLFDPDPAIRARAATEWCRWESATLGWPPPDGGELAQRFRDPEYALAFARLVTHYVRHDAWLEDGALLRNADRLDGIAGVMVKGRFDLQSPLGSAWELHRAWPRSELIVVDDAGHDVADEAIARELVRAADRLAG